MAIKKGIYKYDTGIKGTNGNEIFDEIYFKTLGSLVEEDVTHRFTTDAEKVVWNGKASNSVVTQVANGLMSAVDKKKLDSVQAGANAYVHPSTHGADVIAQDTSHRFVTDAEKAIWNNSVSFRKKTANGVTIFSEYSIDTSNKNMLKWNVSMRNKENQRGFYLAINNVANGNFVSIANVGGAIHFELTLMRGNDRYWVVHWSGAAGVGGQFEYCNVIESAEITNVAVHTGGYGDHMEDITAVMTLV